MEFWNCKEITNLANILPVEKGVKDERTLQRMQ